LKDSGNGRVGRMIIQGKTMKNILIIVCLSLVLAACGENSVQPKGDYTIAEQKIPSLEFKLANEEAIRDIKRLQYAYAHYLNAGQWSEAALLFAENSRAQFGARSTTDPEHLERYLQETMGGANGSVGTGDLNEHLIISPVINIDASGQSARGRWRLVALLGKYGDGAQWLGGIYENVYIKENGIWKISDLHFYPIYAGPYGEGWRNIKEEKKEDVKPIPFHYTADKAGIPTPPVPSELTGASGSNARQQLAELNWRAQKLLDQDAVTNLQNAYGYYFDRKMWDDLVDLFHQDGSMELDHRGVYKGKTSIRKALNQFGKQGLAANEVNDHLQLQPVVSVTSDSNRAQARGTELQMLGVHGQSSKWGVSTFQNEFVKVDGVWKIKSVHVFTRMLTDYDKGWALDAQPAPTAPQEFAADLPVSKHYQAYPEFFVPEFHFKNPARASITDVAIEQLPSSQNVAESVGELERKLRVLNAYDGAENISNAYGYYIDEFMWDGMADVFSVDGWKELSYIGAYVGRERVRNSVVSRYGRGGRLANSNTFHQKTQPVISVTDNGYSAKIRTRLFQTNSSRSNAGSYISGIYENIIVNENGIWKIQGMDLDYAWLASYQGGWEDVKPGSSNRFAPLPGSLKGDQAPDRPLRGMVFAPYPEGQVDMAFHYLNPVSDRKPPIYLPEVNYDKLKFEE